jgi:hypothetical protein
MLDDRRREAMSAVGDWIHGGSLPCRAIPSSPISVTMPSRASGLASAIALARESHGLSDRSRFRRTDKPPKGGFDLLDVRFGHLLQVQKRVPGGIVHANEFVELQVKRLGISALRALDQEDHEERDNRGSRIDYQLPGV